MASFTRGKTLFFTFLGLAIVYGILFHTVRGIQIQPAAEEDFERLIRAVTDTGAIVQSQEDFDRLGNIAWEVVRQNGLHPGRFYILYLPALDTLEKFHHLVHQRFTGYVMVYTDIWINSATVYGQREDTWGIGNAYVKPAHKLAMLLLLIDRLSREMSAVEEHLQCYIEVFTGMEFYTLKGRARVYQLFVSVARRHAVFRDWIAGLLQDRGHLYIDETERQFWMGLAQAPTMQTLQAMSRGVYPDLGSSSRFDPAPTFRKLVNSG